MGERVLITGGAGYIGSVLTPTLLEQGYDVTVLDKFSAGEPFLADCCRFEGFKPVKGDARDEKIVLELMKSADIVIPLAALVGAPLCSQDPYNAESINRDAVRLIVSSASRSQRIVYPTTNSGYGIGQKDQFCTEDTPLNPISLYGTSKVEAEQAILDSGNGVSLRLATVFGMSPKMRIDLLINDFTHRAIEDRVVVVFEGHFKRNYIHVRDVVKAFTHSISNYGEMSGRPFNVGLSNANLSKLEVCAKIKEYVPGFTYFESPIGEDPDKRDYIVSNARLEATGWQPEWSLDDGIKELIKGYTMLRYKRFSNV